VHHRLGVLLAARPLRSGGVLKLFVLLSQLRDVSRVKIRLQLEYLQALLQLYVVRRADTAVVAATNIFRYSLEYCVDVKVCTAAAGSRRQVGPVELRSSLVELR
jgi:hypothetical protein